MATKTITITKNSRKTTVEKALNILKHIIEINDKYKSSYMWNSNGTNASSRRREEFEEHYDLIIFGEKFDIDISLSISANNYYFSKDIYVDEKKRDIRKIKSAIKLLEKKAK